MELSELTDYAEEEYSMKEEHRWPSVPGLSELRDPQSGKRIALLMREWDTYAGRMIERCDLRCGQSGRLRLRYPFFTLPFRMNGEKWAGIVMEENTDINVVLSLFDRAVAGAREEGRFTIVLESRPSRSENTTETVYKDTPLSAAASTWHNSATGSVPEKIFEMIHLYRFGDSSFAGKCRNFYRQGKFMEDFADDAPPAPDFKHYYTTYHDLNITQLRAYFTWRTHVRKGDYRPISSSLAYMYIYELLCGIGTSSPEDAFLKMKDFEREYLDSGIGDRQMRKNIHRWMFDFAVINGLPRETAEKYMNSFDREKDQLLAALRDPQAHTDEEIFGAMFRLGKNELAKGPVVANDPQRGMHLFASAWEIASEAFKKDGRDLFEACFGRRKASVYHPLSNAVYWSSARLPDTVYELDSCRRFICRGGSWTMLCYSGLTFNKEKFGGFLHETDRVFRRYQKTGHYLRKKESEAWCTPFAEEALRREVRALEEANRPKITIHFSGLDRIRQDAAATRDSLLTEEEIEEEPLEEAPAQQNHESQTSAILRKLLNGESADDYIKEHHLIPSVVADEINEAMFDAIGDSVLACDGHTITVVEDYREDLAGLLGGAQD